MRNLVSGIGLSFSLLLLAACGGSNTPAGFTSPDGGGSDATVDGSRGGGLDGGIHLIDTGGGKGGDSAGPCMGIACDVKSCGGGGSTTVSGYVYAPNGQLPLYDVQVFIPNAPLAPFPKGVQCEACGATVSGDPITTGLSDATGHFTLTGVPSGSNIPIVVQLGKWRRQGIIPVVNSCTDNTLTDPNITRLPQNQMEGSMPHIALTTGECDQMGCMLAKLGIDTTEFGYETDGYSKAIHTYVASTGSPITGAAPATDLWSNQTLLNTYDVGIFSCECEEPPEAPAGSAYYTNMTNFLNAGGRIFTTDFMYTWYKFSPDANLGGGSESSTAIGIGEMAGQAPTGANPMQLVTSFPKAAALAAWLKYVFSGLPLPSGASYPADSNAEMGEVEADYVFANVQELDPTKTVTWANSAWESGGFGGPAPPGGATIEPRVFTVDTPVGKPPAMQCGRGVHLDAHIDEDQMVAEGFPTTGCGQPLSADEAMFAFFFFDLSSCIQNEMKQPVPPPPAPK